MSPEPSPAGQPLVAVAVNGVIGGWSPLFKSPTSGSFDHPVGAADKFAMMVPDTLFRAGKNDLAFYLIDTASGQLRLRPLSIAGVLDEAAGR